MTVAKHIFQNVCIDFEPILASAHLKEMMKVIRRQAKTAEAKKRTNLADYKDYEADDIAPMYFGLFTEWLSQNFLNHYGHVFGIANVEMLNTEGNSEDDLGIDGYGTSTLEKRFTKNKAVSPKVGSKVFIQVKGTFNPMKEFYMNDGARLSNFMMYAATTAITKAVAYSSRYILFTTGKGIYHTLEKASNGLMEVINVTKIERLMDNDIIFLNVLRKSVGLQEFDIPKAPLDNEGKWNIEHIEE